MALQTGGRVEGVRWVGWGLAVHQDVMLGEPSWDASSFVALPVALGAVARAMK